MAVVPSAREITHKLSRELVDIGLSARPCRLCDLEPTGRGYQIIDCTVCGLPMVVWGEHELEPPDDILVEMLAKLDDVAKARYPESFCVIGAPARCCLGYVPGASDSHWSAHVWIECDVADFGDKVPMQGGRHIARLGRPDLAHGWRFWKADADGLLTSPCTPIAWPSSTYAATCRQTPRPCPSPPGAGCFCGICLFATFNDAASVYQRHGGRDLEISGAVWGLVTTEGAVRRDQHTIGATWRAAGVTIRALIVGPDQRGRADLFAERYGVEVRAAVDARLGSFIDVARLSGWPAVTRPKRR